MSIKCHDVIVFPQDVDGRRVTELISNTEMKLNFRDSRILKRRWDSRFPGSEIDPNHRLLKTTREYM